MDANGRTLLEPAANSRFHTRIADQTHGARHRLNDNARRSYSPEPHRSDGVNSTWDHKKTRVMLPIPTPE